MVVIGKIGEKDVNFSLDSLTRHAAVLGSTGSGKTVMCKVLIEECLAKGIPVIAIDPKGDIGSLAICDSKYDFRPFVSKGEASKIAQKYSDKTIADTQIISRLQTTKTTIYTPRSNTGVPVSLTPDLSVPKDFAKITDETQIASLIEPISESLIGLAHIHSNKDKVQSYISTIIRHEWTNQRDISVQNLISLITKPPFEQIGFLHINSVINQKERMKVAAALNLLQSSPTHLALSAGKKIDVQKMFAPSTLSVFDLRSAHSEKQIVTEIILQEIYKFLITKPGSEKLRYILYIDEIAGLIPPPPFNPAAKKLLETLIRQGRAFGLGIILATQSPADIDYKLLGNVGTRFIGRLRTQNDIEKAAIGTGFSPADLKEMISSIHTGHFVWNDAISNKTKQIAARWLHTYHGGPLSGQEIAWINNPQSRPVREGTISIQTKKQTKIINKTSSSMLEKLQKSIAKRADEMNVKIEPSQTRTYTPHLRLVITPKIDSKIKLPIYGPYLFDLQTKVIPLDNYLRNRTFIAYNEQEVILKTSKQSIEKAFSLALTDAKQQMRQQYFVSSLTGHKSLDKNQISAQNYAFLENMIRTEQQRTKNRLESKLAPIQQKLHNTILQKRKLSSKLALTKTQRFVTKLFTSRKLASNTKALMDSRKRVERLSNQVHRLEEKIRSIQKRSDERIKLLDKRGRLRAQKNMRVQRINPTRNKMHVSATLLLTPIK